jgi:hypothetical protein
MLTALHRMRIPGHEGQSCQLWRLSAATPNIPSLPPHQIHVNNAFSRTGGRRRRRPAGQGWNVRVLVIEAFGDSAVPGLAETAGFRSALLFADPASGPLISETVWRDPQAGAASPSVGAVIRADALGAANCLIRAVEDDSLVFSSARKA